MDSSSSMGAIPAELPRNMCGCMTRRSEHGTLTEWLRSGGTDRSEPEDFLMIGSRKRSWALMVGLIGEGQEIHLGEEAGLGQWNEAVGMSTDKWTVHCPQKVAHLFPAASQLDVSEPSEPGRLLAIASRGGCAGLGSVPSEWTTRRGRVAQRAHDASRVSAVRNTRTQARNSIRAGTVSGRRGQALWVPGILQGSIESVRDPHGFLQHPENEGRTLVLRPTRIEWIMLPTQLGRDRVSVSGLGVGSSHCRVGSRPSLEGTGVAESSAEAVPARDPHNLRLNSYRVLLTRGRDGSVLFVPDGGAEFDADYNSLVTAGATPL